MGRPERRKSEVAAPQISKIELSGHRADLGAREAGPKSAASADRRTGAIAAQHLQHCICRGR
jgi:hypothetical protein